jgi:Uma2 family endonuclease
MGMPAVKRRWTAADVRALRDASPLATPRYELVDGELLVTSSPNGPHQLAVKELLLALDAYLRANRIGSVLTSPFDVEVETDFLSQPDVFVVPMHELKRLRTELPARELLLACEVLSPSSLRHDRVTKRPHYQRNVSEYWIVNLTARVIERWQPGKPQEQVISDVLQWHPADATAAFRLDIPDYFRRVFGDE